MALNREPRRLTVLGATGSIGRATLDLIAEAPPGTFVVEALVANGNAEALAAAARRVGARLAVLADDGALSALRSALEGSGIRAEAGPQAVLAAAAIPVDWTMAAIVGAAGLPATMAAAAGGGILSIANKECLVCAGAMLRRVADAAGTTLLPVDSEHNAIFQALDRTAPASVERIVLTASGGPFRDWPAERMRAIRPQDALNHPVWRMGAKVTIDSATMMNKGLEVIEAACLFPVPPDRIEVLVHPEAVVHGIVQYVDGSMLAQMGPPDMRVPIAHTLAWPRRMATATRRLDLASLGRMTFEPPDLERFPALALARQALAAGGAAPTILNAANEVAVQLFLDGRIDFLGIAALVAAALDRLGAPPAPDLEAVLEADAAARRTALALAAGPAFA
ncbi:1-deoxy-D-xylulose-5-phosphate reductoisomerase [Elioraea sp. Yellowstone]|uniref:1-deoxy-D-xylulose-5-phosphate reductoisomerase n=1 Tax=Elioraea sp. Yellowstone TaxID=2592070 RepID=UPI001150556C|nr:1-deoxy-D-xylulose-5-phosphate reductoisomerase [Elioraea sp. Yellowstone]TQF79414.1 1-deoxy-D-xylulose-5-phosphate reductoisomerase [Elioraea sp. Yellowstone]